jgi:apolipoprotein N-acyltransferase
MIAIISTLLTAVCFYFSIGIGDAWYLAWFAPLPVLMLAYGGSNRWAVFFAAFLGAALGSCCLLRAYGGVLPAYVLALEIGVPAFLFALAVLVSRVLHFKRGPLSAALAFATLWAAFDFLISFGKGGGAIATPAAAEMGMPVLVQSLSLFGFPAVTFLLGFVPAGIAAGIASRRAAPALAAAGLFALNLGFGAWHMAAPPMNTLRVALVDGNRAVGSIGRDDEAGAERALEAYFSAIEPLKGKVDLIVLPENIAYLAPGWRARVVEQLASAATTLNATLVAGFNTDLGTGRGNVSMAFVPGQAEPLIYQKRALVPVLETRYFQRGAGPKSTPSGIGLEVCKDMDFQAMIRSDAVATTPSLLAVPAWDFNLDDWSHARVAVMRSVENGVPMARSARNGLLTLNDRYGRVLLKTRTVDAITVASGELPLSGSGGGTLYDKIGDSFGWLTVLFGALFVLLSFAARKAVSKEKSQAERVASSPASV